MPLMSNVRRHMSHWPLPLRVLTQTYVFWAVVSLANFSLLGGLAIPPLAFYARLIPFLTVPVAVCLAVAALAMRALPKLAPSINRTYAPLVFNLLVLLLLVPTADVYKNHLIDQHLIGHMPHCVGYGSFRASAFESGRNFVGNGIYEEGGKVYLWSYSERQFFEASPGLARNFSCRK